MDFDKILKTYEKEEEDKSDEIIFDEEEEENPSVSESIHKKSSKMKSNQVVETSQDLVLKNNQKKNLIEKEKMDTGKLRLKDWWNFYKYGTGVTGLLLTFFFTIISSVFFLSVSYVIGLWARKDFDEQQESYYFNLFYTAVLAYFVLIYIRSIVISFSCWISSKNLHSLMVYKVFRAPIQFFDTTPIGRIVTRLSQDIG